MMDGITRQALVVDSNEERSQELRAAITAEGWDCRVLDSAERLNPTLITTPFSILILARELVEDDLELILSRVRHFQKETAVVLMSEITSFGEVVRAIRMGVFHYLAYPFKDSDVREILQDYAQSRSREKARTDLRERLKKGETFGELVGASDPMQEIFDTIRKVSRRPTTVLIQGESGTGKELIARAIHQHGPLNDRPFMPIDCASINQNLIESELFGHVKGAFTGAHVNKMGLFRLAEGGSVFLDEISEIPPDVQAKLLRALQERKIRAVGGTEWVQINVRVIAATNRNLTEAVESGVFRSDLFYRLNVVPIEVPPLRNRKSDIEPLVRHFMKRYRHINKQIDGIAREALFTLQRYDWPGNVRELENTIERSYALGTGKVIRREDLPQKLRDYAGTNFRGGDEQVVPLEDMEKMAILRALQQAKGDKLAAAKLLRIHRSTLYRKLKRYKEPD